MLKRIRSRTWFRRIKAKIERRNASFEKLTPAKQRIVVAKDVIEQLGTGAMIASHTYFGAHVVRRKDVTPGSDFSEVLERLPTCNVCAVGSIFVSLCKRRDRYPVTDGTATLSLSLRTSETAVMYSRPRGTYFNVDAHAYIDRTNIFDRDQIEQMERVFERHTIIFASDVDDNEVLRQIMKNLIRNKGTFVMMDDKMHRVARRLNRAVGAA